MSVVMGDMDPFQSICCRISLRHVGRKELPMQSSKDRGLTATYIAIGSGLKERRAP